MIDPEILKKVESVFGEYMIYTIEHLVQSGEVQNNEIDILSAATQWEILFENDNHDAAMAEYLSAGAEARNF